MKKGTVFNVPIENVSAILGGLDNGESAKITYIAKPNERYRIEFEITHIFEFTVPSGSDVTVIQ